MCFVLLSAVEGSLGGLRWLVLCGLGAGQSQAHGMSVGEEKLSSGFSITGKIIQEVPRPSVWRLLWQCRVLMVVGKWLGVWTGHTFFCSLLCWRHAHPFLWSNALHKRFRLASLEIPCASWSGIRYAVQTHTCQGCCSDAAGTVSHLSCHAALFFPRLLCSRFAMDTCPVTTRTDPQAPLLFCLSFFFFFCPHPDPSGTSELWFLSVMDYGQCQEMEIKASPPPTPVVLTFQRLSMLLTQKDTCQTMWDSGTLTLWGESCPFVLNKLPPRMQLYNWSLFSF